MLHQVDFRLVASSNKSNANPESSTLEKPNLESITLIWYDPQNDKTEDTKRTLETLREINDKRRKRKAKYYRFRAIVPCG
ncbi:unnamed protein product [Adineta steineri]|uniref:Uncharacterized protein n=2 Tax=Adineta steineri TaxID=433720 RepID=A0A815RE30_9BILA|nr:unnamed protein product [Adineta steineri]